MHIHAIHAYTYIHAYMHITYIAVSLDHIRTYMIYIFMYEPTDPLARRGFADGDCPAASTGDPEVESQQELFSRLGRDTLARGGARSRLRRVGGQPTGCAFVDVQEGNEMPSTPARGGAESNLRWLALNFSWDRADESAVASSPL
jgi:hypothetical protein